MTEQDLIQAGFRKFPDGSWGKTGINGEVGIDLSPKKANPTKPADPRQKYKGWYDFSDGKRYYLKSKWELHYAKYLEFLKKNGQIADWLYEPDTFYFDGLKRGTNNYTPDFKIMLPDGGFYYVEVKGYWDAKSNTKFKRMGIYHPHIRIEKADREWFSTVGKKMKGVLW